MRQGRNHTGLVGRQRFGALPWLVLCALMLTACANFGGPAPINDRSYSDREGRAAGPGEYVVRRGETVYGIAQRHNISTRALIDRNNLRPPYRLTVGTRLQLPTTQTYTVSRGDTLYGVSRRYGVDMASLARANRLRQPYTIHVGQRLVLPVEARLVAPPRTQVARVQTRSEPQSQVAVVPRSAVSNTSSGPQPRSKPAFAPAVPIPKRDAGGFIWPVDGRVVSSFGAKKSGLHNDGLNIAAPMGAPVRAADNGVVAYAGDQIRGFGNMLLIKHADGLITAYAHTDKLLVSRGDVVSRGQVVARVGKSGGIETPQLHFEVRQKSRAVDPRKFLPS